MKSERLSLKLSSAGHGKIPMLLFRDIIDVLGPAMLRICNSSLREGIFPEISEIVKVLPVFNNGNHSDMDT